MSTESSLPNFCSDLLHFGNLLPVLIELGIYLSIKDISILCLLRVKKDLVFFFDFLSVLDVDGYRYLAVKKNIEEPA